MLYTTEKHIKYQCISEDSMDKFKLEFNMQELEVLDEALCAMPYKKVAGIIKNINTQIQESISARTTTANTTNNDSKSIR